jgi:hypothetical protein
LTGREAPGRPGEIHFGQISEADDVIEMEVSQQRVDFPDTVEQVRITHKALKPGAGVDYQRTVTPSDECAAGQPLRGRDPAPAAQQPCLLDAHA